MKDFRQSVCTDDPSLVGDPVSVITGAVIDFETDFRLPGAAVPISFTRYYNSSRASTSSIVGRGFRHSFDIELIFDLDGILFVDGRGNRYEFGPLDADGAQEVQDGTLLTRIDAHHYRWLDAEGCGFLFELRRETPGFGVPVAYINEQGASLELRYDVAKRRLVAIIVDLERKIEFAYHDTEIGAFLASASLVDRPTGKKLPLVHFTYDTNGCLLTATNAYKNTLAYRYDAKFRQIAKTDRKRYTFTFAYDDQGKCIATRGEDGVEDLALEYRKSERTTIVTRADGAVRTYNYDESGQIRQIIAPDGGATIYPVDDEGRVCGVVDPRGNETHYLFDQRGNIYAQVDPLGHVRAYPVDESEHPLSHRIAATPLAWDLGDWGEIPELRLAPSHVPAHLPDVIKKRLFVENEIPGPPQEIRDLQGVLHREIDEQGRKRRHSYNGNGYPRWVQDFDGPVTRFHYGSWNHLEKIIDGLDHVTQFGYGQNDQINVVVDAGGTRTEYGYDLCDRLNEVRRHGKVRERYVHDLAGNLIARLAPDGSPLLERAIGKGNLVKKRSFASGEVYRYDHNESGRLTLADGPGGRCTFSYGPNGRRSGDQRNKLGVVHKLVGAQVHATTLLDRFTTKYRRTDDQTLEVQDPTGATVSIRDLGLGLVERDDANGLREVTQYDLYGRCLVRALTPLGERNESKSAIDPHWYRSFHYSGEGDLILREDSQHGNTRYEVDPAHRLHAEIRADGQQFRYAYDAGANLLEAPGLKATFGAGNLIFRANDEHFEHNERDHICARRSSAGDTTYTYGARDQLVAARGPGYEYSAKFDGLGRRIEKTVNGETTRFYWDSDRLAAEVFHDESLRIYVYADDFSRTPLAFVDYDSRDAAPESGKRYAVYASHQGCPERVVDANGEVVWAARIEAYGRAEIIVGEDFHQPLRWPGHYFDRETGLQDNRFRTYDPGLGRYLQSDPIGLEGGLNLYAYTQNPLREVDLRGTTANSCPHGKKEGEVCDECGGDGEGRPKTPLTERRARLKEQARERERVRILDEAVAKADKKGARESLTPEERKFIDADPDHARLAVDPDGDGKYRVSEAQSALAAVDQGKLTAPVRRALAKVDGAESGGDLVDGDGKVWDHKDHRMGSEMIARTANNGERVLVDGLGLTNAQAKKLEGDIRAQLVPAAGEVIIVRR